MIKGSKGRIDAEKFQLTGGLRRFIAILGRGDEKQRWEGSESKHKAPLKVGERIVSGVNGPDLDFDSSFCILIKSHDM